MERIRDPERLTRREFVPRLATMVSAALACARSASAETSPDWREKLQGIERDCLRYFVENQTEQGLFLDRQRNRGKQYESEDVPCSTAATGMGFVALALAAQQEHRLLDSSEARKRCANGMNTALHMLPAEQGIMPHFLLGSCLEPWGEDTCSTIDSAWLIAGAGCAAELLNDNNLREQATALYQRVDWRYWTNGNKRLLSYGKNRDGAFLHSWDRLNGETAFMYVLAAGAEGDHAIESDAWSALQPCIGEAEGLKFASADLGLFTHQFGNDLLDLNEWHNPRNIDPLEHARLAARANVLACTRLGKESKTFRSFWGRSAGDGPGDEKHVDEYRAYTLRDSNDGTAHIMASIAAISYEREAVLRNIVAAEAAGLRGRYAYSNVNLDRQWSSTDAVGIDVGDAAMALDNALYGNRVRRAFHALPYVQRGLQRLGFRREYGASTHQTSSR